jgi:hypothetical protein
MTDPKNESAQAADAERATDGRSTLSSRLAAAVEAAYILDAVRH